MTMKDTISLATELALSSDVNYNPGLPITVGFRPITVPAHLGNPSNTPPHTNIYREDPPYRTSGGTLTRDSINAKIYKAIKDGGRGNSTDYAGCLMLAFFSRDPEQWDNLFFRKTSRLSIPILITLITGLPDAKAKAFIKGSEFFFPGGEGLDPEGHERILRANLKF